MKSVCEVCDAWECVCGARVIQEHAAYLAEVWLLGLEPSLQVLQEAPLEAVDLLDIPKDGDQLLLAEHVRPLTTLPDISLHKQ